MSNVFKEPCGCLRGFDKRGQEHWVSVCDTCASETTERHEAFVRDMRERTAQEPTS